jgi:hypothetical protein
MKPFAEWRARHVVVGAGLGLLAALIFGLVIRYLPPKSGIKLLVVGLIQGTFHFPVTPPPSAGPDPPVVVSGGSVNFFANNNAAGLTGGWQQVASTNLYSENVLGPPSAVQLDGILVDDGSGHGVPGSSYLSLPNNWTIVLTMRKNDLLVANTLNICTQLDGTSKKCNLSPTGALSSNLIYVDGVLPGVLKLNDFDRSSQNARLHYSDLNCYLGGIKNGSVDPSHPDADKQCDHIQSFTVTQATATVPVTSPPTSCMDGACRIEINHP